jgi:hypothetical protein
MSVSGQATALTAQSQKARTEPPLNSAGGPPRRIRETHSRGYKSRLRLQTDIAARTCCSNQIRRRLPQYNKISILLEKRPYPQRNILMPARGPSRNAIATFDGWLFSLRSALPVSGNPSHTYMRPRVGGYSDYWRCTRITKSD